MFAARFFVLPFFWKRWRHPPVRGDKSAQACSHNLPLQLLWHPPLPFFFNAPLESPRSAAGLLARPPSLNKKTGFRKRKPVISGNPDLNPPKIEEPLKMERASGPFRLIDKTARRTCLQGRLLQTKKNASVKRQKRYIGQPGFEPGASTSRT